MKNVLLFLTLTITVFTLFSCQEEIEWIDPQMETLFYSDVTSTSALFKGKFTERGNYEISEYGFVWSKSENPILDNDKYHTVGSGTPTEIYEWECRNLEVQTEYHYTTYAKSNLGDVYYGEVKRFTTKLPVFSDFKPKYAYQGDRITITGSDFGHDLSMANVWLNDVNTEIDSMANGQIYITLPDLDLDIRRIKIRASLSSVEKDFSSTELIVLEGHFNNIDKLPGDAVEAHGFSIEGKPYILKCTGELYCYNNGWIEKAKFPGKERYQAISFSINGKGYIGLGNTISYGYGEILSDLWEYNPINDSWAQKADYPAGPRTYAVCFTIDELAFVGLGYDGLDHDDFYMFSPGDNQWLKSVSFPQKASKGAIGFSINNKGYVGFNNKQKTVYELDLLNNEWVLKTTFPGGFRGEASAISMGETALLFFGVDGTFPIGHDYNFYTEVWEYYPMANDWIKRTDFDGPGRANGVVVKYNENILCGGGLKSIFIPLNDYYVYSIK